MRRVRSRGSTAVEFAVVLPVAIMLTFGAIEIGRMITCRMMLSYAVAEGVQRAATLGVTSHSEVETVVINASPMLNLNAGNIDVLVNANSTESASAFSGRAANDTVTVSATYTFQSIYRPTTSTKTWTETSAAMRVQ
jgi:Flp pilus assembly protein TadG